MSIKQNGGVFGRNPTFNDVTIEGDLIINGEVFTGLDFQGSWNASTNSPALASSVGTNGEFYIVSIAGTTDLNGITNWGIGDWAIFNGTVWQRVEGGADGNFNDLTANSLLVNGTATMDGLTVETVQGDVKVLSSSSTLDFNRAGTNYIRASSATGSFSFITGTGGFTNVRQTIGPTGDIGFRNDAGIEKFFWDASAESLGIGTSSPTSALTTNVTADGAIHTFSKSDVAVGSIGVVNGNNLTVGGDVASHAGMEFGTNQIAPRSGGTSVDATVDLGYFSLRWKDLYLSGGVYLGGTGAANKLDDYEEGTWTGVSTATGTNSVELEEYTKIGDTVHITCRVTFSGASGGLSVTGLPYSVANNAVGIGREDTASGYAVYARILSNNNSLNFYYAGATGNATPFQVAAGQFVFNLTYKTDA